MCMTVKDVIEHLQQLPPDMPIWKTWDESGECWPILTASDLPGKRWYVDQTEVNGVTLWMESCESGLEVCMFGG